MPNMFYVRNNQFLPASALELNEFELVASIYEVLRIIDGVPLFVQKHLERLNKSAHLAGLNNQFNISEITTNIINLAAQNQITTGNIKLVYTFNSASSRIASGELFIYFIPHHYPDQADYQTGVKMISLISERPNPQAKIQNADLRNRANELISKEKIFEALLVNHNGFITEGSRSNVFFISGSNLITPPLEIVLPGITRELVIEICKKQNIVFEEKMIHLSLMNDFEAAFITGTSPKVLPVSAIDDYSFNPQHILLQRIMKYYDEMISDYLKNFKH